LIKKGDIVLVSFPFTNLEGNKRRPAVILFVGELDVVAVFITSRINNPTSFEMLINPSKNNQLKKPSLIKTTKVCALDKKLIKGKLGSLTLEEREKLSAMLRQAFKLD
jgi:mRNA interferase MazF